MRNIHFSLIEVAGYRGRNFKIEIHPRDQNSVFIMDGNTGKTTTIELLRWCFTYPQSDAVEKFKHMWADPAHVLDDTKDGHQKCGITIQFSAIDDNDREHFFKYQRITEGEFNKKHDPLETGDIISSITDTLEIDRGKKVLQGDEVFEYLALEFRFYECAEYFCFDGEKAREVMQLTSNSEKIEDLLNLVNRRTTHPKLEEYKEELNKLRQRVLEAAKATITTKALKINMGKLHNKIRELRQIEKFLQQKQRDIEYHRLALKRLKDEFDQIHKQITSAKAAETIERNRCELEQKNIVSQISERRRELFRDIEEWVSADMTTQVNQIKDRVKEKGKLPEPYREDLISNCLKGNSCEICGRSLDSASRARIKMLERQVAPHGVQVFLSSEFTLPTSTFDPKGQYSSIKELINKYGALETRIKSIELSEKDKKLISRRDFLDAQIDSMNSKLIKLEIDEGDLKELKTKTEKDVKNLQDKNAALKENKIILEKIDDAIEEIEQTAQKIKVRATEIISDVISEGVSSILGPKFSAKLSQAEGLMLGEASGGEIYYGKEKGGYSGRLILSYCFAEAMTLVDPIIVDTPVGNIGSHREKLAAHLRANHRQVIVLCLPTEISNFAPEISSVDPIEIQNVEK